MDNKNISFAMDELDYLMVKVARVHGDNHPELIEIRDCYLKLKDALNNNLEEAKALVSKASELSNGFSLPADACQAYTRVYNAYKMLAKELNV